MPSRAPSFALERKQLPSLIYTSSDKIGVGSVVMLGLLKTRARGTLWSRFRPGDGLATNSAESAPCYQPAAMDERHCSPTVCEGLGVASTYCNSSSGQLLCFGLWVKAATLNC